MTARETAVVIKDAVEDYIRAQHRQGSALKGFAVSEIQLADYDPGRVDVVGFWPKTGTTWIEGFEIKASRSDFYSDIKDGKYERYLPYVDGFWFVVADGVAKASEVPKEIGFMVVTADGTRRVHRRPRSPTKRVDGRQMDRIATRLVKDAPEHRWKAEELERIRTAIRRQCEVSESRDPMYSRSWGNWLASDVRERIREADATTERAARIIADAERRADRIIADAERRANEINVDERLQAWSTAEALIDAARTLMWPNTYGLERSLVDAIQAAEQKLDEVRAERLAETAPN